MDMLDLTKEELESYDALVPGLNKHTQQVVNSIVFQNVDPRVKAVIAIAQITNFASQFKRKIVLWDDTLVPINAISFVVMGSGDGKDSSVKAARKCFKDGYKLVESAVEEMEIDNAQQAASEAGESNPEMEGVYKPYMKPIPPIDIMPTTGPGLIKHINDIGALDMTSGFLYTGEFSDELAYNQDMVENIKILSEVYDTGDKEVKYTKSAEHRSEVIESQAVSALFVGSPGHILYDAPTKKKFEIAFMSKLARRSWFCYSPDRIPEKEFDSIDEMLEYEEQLEAKALDARNKMAQEVRDITEFGISTAGKDITIHPDVAKLFKVYKRYNSEYVNSLPSQDTTYALIRRHLQWKALKLAGAYALFDKSNQIELHHYVEAIKFAELLDKDMELFEHDLNKSYHEIFADYIRTQVDNSGKASISIHDIKKLGFISSVTYSKLQELVTLCSGYDTEGIFKIEDDGGSISYERIIKTDMLGVSYKPIDNTALNAAITANDTDAVRDAKHAISLGTAYGFDALDAKFDQLSELLEGDYAYSPFRFKNGVRGKDNIIGGTSWVVLDIDHTTISASEAHFMLSDVNHYVALSSDPNNEHKYRVILQLDSVVDIGPLEWKYFYSSLADEFALKVDLLPQSQIFFSYSDRPIMSVTDAEPVKVRKHLLIAHEKASKKEVQKVTSPAHAKALLADPLETFKFAYEAEYGEGSRSLIRLAYYAIDLGASLDFVLQQIDDVNDYWMDPMPTDRIEKLKAQAERMFQQ